MSADLFVTPDDFPGADDTGKCQAAIDFCAAQASDPVTGGAVLMLPRLYTVTGLDVNDPNIAIRGIQPGRFYDSSAGGGLRLADGSNRSLLKIAPEAGAGTIADLYLDANGDNQTEGHAIEFVPAAGGESVESNWILNNVRIRKAKQDGIHQGAGRRGMRFLSPYIYDVGRTGLYLGGSDNFVGSSAIGACGSRGIEISNWTNTIAGGNIWDCATGIWANGVSTRSLTIRDVQLDRHLGAVIYIDDSVAPASHVIIGGVQVHHNGLGPTPAPTIYLGADYASVTNCMFRPLNTGFAGTNSYNIFVPAARPAGTHDIHSNQAAPNASTAGLLNYRGGILGAVFGVNSVMHMGPVSFNGSTPVAKGAITGFRATRDKQMRDYLALIGLITDNSSTTAIDNSPDLILTDVKGSGVHGGSAVAGPGRNIRQLTSVLLARGGFASAIAGGQFTLAAGTYQFLITAAAHKVDGHKAFLRNITAGTDALEGRLAYAGAAADVSTESTIYRSLVIATPTVFEVQHQCETARATDGLGRGMPGVSGTFCALYVTRIA